MRVLKAGGVQSEFLVFQYHDGLKPGITDNGDYAGLQRVASATIADPEANAVFLQIFRNAWMVSSPDIRMLGFERFLRALASPTDIPA